MSLENIGTLPETPTYINRWKGAIIKVASDIMNEATNTPHHSARKAIIEVALANKKDKDNIYDLNKIATNMARFALATNTTLSGSDIGGTDSDIEYVRNILLADPTYLALLI